VFAAIISRALFYYAFHAGAPSAEDVAQDVIIHILKRPPWVRSNMRGYLRAAVSHEVCNQYRRASRAPLSLDTDRLLVPNSQDDDASDTVDRLVAEYPELVAYLIDYSERLSWGVADRVKASRSRRKLREVLAT